MRAIAAFISVALFTFDSGCRSRGDAEEQAQYPQALVLLNGARDVKYSEKDDIKSLSYNVEEPFTPANLASSRALREITAAMEAQEWHPLTESVFNPGLPSSHERGWTSFVDGTVAPKQTVHQWLAQWVNSDGDVLSYSLSFRCALDDARHSDKLYVDAVLFPSGAIPISGGGRQGGAIERKFVLRVSIADATADRPLKADSKVEVRGLRSSWWFRSNILKGGTAPYLAKWPVDAEVVLNVHLSGLEGEQIEVMLRMTREMCPTGCEEDEVLITVTDDEVIVAGRPVAEANGVEELRFSRR